MSNVEARFPTAANSPKPSAVALDQAGLLRIKTIALAEQIDLIPDSRWKSLALTALEESLMWANKALFNPGPM